MPEKHGGARNGVLGGSTDRDQTVQSPCHRFAALCSKVDPDWIVGVGLFDSPNGAAAAKAQGCEARATLGRRPTKITTPTGLWPTLHDRQTEWPQPRCGWEIHLGRVTKHRRTGRASSRGWIPRRVTCVVAQARDRMGREICLGLIGSSRKDNSRWPAAATNLFHQNMPPMTGSCTCAVGTDDERPADCSGRDAH